MESILINVVYPPVLQNKIEGKVLVKTTIDEEGNVTDAEIEEGDNKLLNTAAIDAVRATKFIPGKRIVKR
jgi:TonB family protein